MTSETIAGRCPSCGAAVRADADWCNQCYVSLRPEPTPPPAEPTVEVAQPTTAGVNAPATLIAEPPGALPTAPPLPGVVTADPLLDVPAAPAAQAPAVPTAPTTWPCARCKTAVPFDDDACPNCGARFLDAALPGAEQTLLDKLPQGPRKPTNAFLVMVVGSVVVMAIIVGLLALLGTIL